MAKASNSRRPDPLEEEARLLAAEAGQDPDARVPHASKPGRTQPLWTAWRDAARAALTAERQAVAAAEIASLRPQADRYRDSPLVVLGEHEDSTIAQMKNCMGVGNAVAGVVCADGHLGYAQPVGGVIAYEGQVSVSGVGFDIGCGNMAVRLDTPFEAIKDRVSPIMADIRRNVSFGVGRVNDERVEHPLLDDSEAWRASGMEDYRQKARAQLGTVGSGNHYVDLMADGEGLVWIGVHFGSRGLGHTSATRYLKLGGGKDGIHVPPTVLDEASDLGRGYLAAMDLAGRYAYAGREWVVERVRRIIGGAVTDSVHNHHNFCVAGDQIVPTPDGPKRMTELSAGDEVYAFDPKTGLVRTRVLEHLRSGRKPILRIRTFNRSIRVSAEHPIQVVEIREEKHPERPWFNKRIGRLGWKRAAEIAKGDVVVCAEGFYDQVEQGWDANMARLVGAFLGDGWTSAEPAVQGHTVGLAIGGPGEAHTAEYLALLRAVAPHVEWRDNRPGEFGIVGADKATHTAMRLLGIGGTSAEKRLPRLAFSLPLRLRLELLAGYFDADGTVATDGTSNHGRGTLASVNRVLVEDLRELAISCGLRVTPVREEGRETNFGPSVAYRCVLSAPSAADLPLWHQTKAVNLKRDVGGGDNQGLAPRKIGYLELPARTFVQTVQAVEADREDDVFDITVVHASQSFVCEGIVVHNCWKERHVVGGVERDLWVVRKGATPAFPGQRGFVGGSMGDDAVILEGVESEASKRALYSTVHGAGRVFGRKEAKRRFTREQMDVWLRERGVQLLGGDLDESPMAYRRLPEVLAHHAGTVRVRHTLRPFGVVMAGEGEFDPFKD